jgi:membrane protease YdiL (CAAX protease family)
MAFQVRKDLTTVAMNAIIEFFLLAYALSWCAFIPLALDAQGILNGVPAWLHLIGAFGPLISAFIVTGFTRGTAGLRELVSRMLRWRIGWQWLSIALFSPVVVFLLAVLIFGVATGDWSTLKQFGVIAELPGVRGILGWLVWTLTFGLGEETGWRGFALPRLQRHASARKASIVVGLWWAGWHIPVFFYNYAPSLFGVIAFVVGILSGSALLTWLYNSTGGSVLAAILWHGSYNAAVAGAEGIVAAAVTAVVILAVILIANRYGPETFSHREKHIL